MITNFQRIVLGTPPKAPKRKPILRTGRRVRRASTRLPWDITATPQKQLQTKSLMDHTGLPGPRIRPAKMIKNLERVVLGTPPKTTIRPQAVRRGPKVQRSSARFPWDITLTPSRSATGKRATRQHPQPTIDVYDPLGLFGTPRQSRRKGRRRSR